MIVISKDSLLIQIMATFGCFIATAETSKLFNEVFLTKKKYTEFSNMLVSGLRVITQITLKTYFFLLIWSFSLERREAQHKKCDLPP